MAEGYQLIFEGELVEGFGLEQVKARVAQLFKMEAAQVEAMFSHPRVALQKGLASEQAKRFHQALLREGLVTRVVAMAPAADAPAEGSAGPAAAAPVADNPAAHSEASDGGEQSAAGDTAAEQGGAHPFAFHGQGGEYFRIWIVNICLTIITLGFYSPWAKVRSKRYFYGNTELDGQRFEYLASPWAIFKGRLIAVSFFLLYSVVGQFSPELGLLFLVLFLLLLPWMIQRSLIFRARYTSYRGVRFGFDGSYVGALLAFIVWPVAAALSFGLLTPVALAKQQAYLAGNSRYGTAGMAFELRYGPYYTLFVTLIAVGVVGGLAFAGLGAIFPPLGLLVMPVLYLFFFAYFNAGIGNLLYNNTSLDEHHFTSELETGALAKIYFINFVTLLLSLGLAYPWAKVRLARYRAERLTLHAASSLDAFAAAEERDVSALGEEMGEVFDFDIGL